MNDELLKNIHNHLIENKLTNSDFDTWKNNIGKSSEIQSNVYNYLSKNKLTTSDFDTWKNNVGLKKKDNSQSSGEVSQEVSPIQPKKKQSLLVGENQGKVQSVWDTLAGKSNKPVEIGGFQLNKPTGNKPKKVTPVKPIPAFDKMDISQLARFDKGEEVTYGGFNTNISATNVKKDNKNEVHFKNFINKSYQEALPLMGSALFTSDDYKKVEDAWNILSGKSTKPNELGGFQTLSRPNGITSPEDLAGNEYKQAQKGGSFFDKAKSYASSILSYISMEEDEDGSMGKVKNPLDDYRDQVKKEAAKNKEVLLPGQIEYRVKQKFIEDRVSSIKQSKINAVKEGLTPAQQYAVGKHIVNTKYKHLSQENKDLEQSRQEVITTTKSLIQQKKDIDSKYKGTQIPVELLNKYNEINDSIHLNNAIIKHKQDLINKNNKDLGSVSDEIKAWTSNNNELVQIGQGFTGWITKAAGNVLSYQASFAKRFPKSLDYGGIVSLAGEAENVLAENVKKRGEEISEGIEIVPDVRVGGITREKDLNKDHVVNGVLNYVNSWTADNVGMVASTFTGYGGVAFLALETAGEKQSQIEEENNAFEKAKQEAVKNNEKEFEFDGKKHKVTEDELHSTLAEIAVPILYGGSTMLPIAKNAKFFRNEMRLLQSLEKESPDLLINSQKNAFLSSAKNKGANYLAETLELTKYFKIMRLTQAVADDFGLGKKQNYSEILFDLKHFRDAALFHGANKIAAFAVGQGSRPYMTNEEAKILDNNSAILIDSYKELLDPNKTKEEKTIIKNHIKRVAKESQAHIDNIVDRMGEMSDADYKKAYELANKSSELRLEASTIRNSDIPTDKMKIALEGVKKDYLQNEAQLKDVIQNYTKRSDGFYGLSEREKVKYLDKASKELKSEAENNGEKDFSFSARDINIKAQEIYNLEKTTETKPKGVEDVMSQPIELEVPAKTEEKLVEEVKHSGQKVSDVINRPATLESFGGSKLESPIEGDLYQEGQRIIFEDKNNKTYDLGGVEELGKNAEEIGLKPQEPKIEVSNDGKVIVDGNEWNMQMDLPTKGIEYDKDGNITRVSLKDSEGKTKMWDGQIAEDIGYQVLLKEMENPERTEEIEKTLKEDEQYQNRITEIENAPKEGTDTSNEQDITEVKPKTRRSKKTKVEEKTPNVEEPVTEEKAKESVSLPENETDLHNFLLEMQEKGIIEIKPCE